MEEYKAYTSSSEAVSLPDLLQPRQIPADIPQDVDDDFIDTHLNDPNFDLTKRPKSTSFELDRKKGSTGYQSDIDTESQTDHSSSRPESRNSTGIEFDDDSPYPEVRAAVASVDDPTIPCNTFRMWTLGLFFTVLVCGLNQAFTLRYPSLYITGVVVQLASLPCGKLWERIVPKYQFNFFGYKWSLNPGPFTVKEHVCITVMANVVVNGAYATEITSTQRMFYDQELTFAYEVLLALGTQVLGFSLGGLLRQFVVWPSSMIWPGALVNAALFNTLHKTYGKRDRGHMPRERFFFIVCACSFAYYWLPGYLFTALSIFNWVCWIAPTNVTVNTLFGINSGLGMGILTFDWSMISYVNSPLVSPWWSEVNTAAALLICYWLIVPLWYFTNTWYTAYLPIMSTSAYDRNGSTYDPLQIVNGSSFDVEGYRSYSPVYISATLIMAYGCAFGAFSSIIVHTFLWYRHDIARRFHSSLKDERDVHSRLMQVYPEVPFWWYLCVGIASLVCLFVSIEIFPTELPIWAAFFGFVLAACLAIPQAMIQAITNQPVALQVMHELIAGYILPGRPIANMIFKCIAYTGTSQAVAFAGDLKLGHYMKVPPRVMFSVQVVAVVVCCFIVTAVQDMMYAIVPDFCSSTQADGFTCPSTDTVATASLIWGGVGPSRIFSVGAPYSPMLLFFLVGAVLPIPFYFLARRFPLSIWRYINIPVFFAGVGAMPPATGINYASWAIAGFVFNYYIRKFHFRWWMRYNYILSAGLDAGVAISLVCIFFFVQLPKGGTITLDWWGNDVWVNTADTNGTPLKTAPADGFGPTSWS
ncbi:OPT superfamily oligopeptide transporter [Fistulina hepatica ATCC 64428]|uniref:OPT superfamily oligopeptide transporter n=1 Tax=Fistulina hepatica ATCC 64428 TaxID=1128425 RepID=A0A0D7A386_9AGAR|nr:OPT superfamily oligopeptide transporter [Fistulina hepatica ATCC 64428]